MKVTKKHPVGTIYKTNRDGDVVILERKPNVALVKFLNTNYERWVDLHNLSNGKCQDHSVKREIPWAYINIPFTANNGSTGVMFAKRSNKVLVRFDKTNHVMECYLENIRKGKVQDPYEKTFLGVGYLGEFEKVSYWRQAKQLWSNMMKRCYNPKDNRGYFYKGVTVDERWHCFSNFMQDIKELENFDAWLLGHEEGNIKYNLDKDYIVKDNKVYSKDLCVFLTEKENKSLGKLNKTLINNEWVSKE